MKINFCSPKKYPKLYKSNFLLGSLHNQNFTTQSSRPRKTIEDLLKKDHILTSDQYENLNKRPFKNDLMYNPFFFHSFFPILNLSQINLKRVEEDNILTPQGFLKRKEELTLKLQAKHGIHTNKIVHKIMSRKIMETKGKTNFWNPKKKLSREEMAQVRRLKDEQGKSILELSNRFGVSTEAISRILRSKWRNEEDSSIEQSSLSSKNRNNTNQSIPTQNKASDGGANNNNGKSDDSDASDSNDEIFSEEENQSESSNEEESNKKDNPNKKKKERIPQKEKERLKKEKALQNKQKNPPKKKDASTMSNNSQVFKKKIEDQFDDFDDEQIQVDIDEESLASQKSEKPKKQRPKKPPRKDFTASKRFYSLGTSFSSSSSFTFFSSSHLFPSSFSLYSTSPNPPSTSDFLNKKRFQLKQKDEAFSQKFNPKKPLNFKSNPNSFSNNQNSSKTNENKNFNSFKNFQNQEKRNINPPNPNWKKNGQNFEKKNFAPRNPHIRSENQTSTHPNHPKKDSQKPVNKTFPKKMDSPIEKRQTIQPKIMTPEEIEKEKRKALLRSRINLQANEIFGLPKNIDLSDIDKSNKKRRNDEFMVDFEEILESPENEID